MIINSKLKISIFSKFSIFWHFFDLVYSLCPQHFSYSNHISKSSYFQKIKFNINAKSSESLSSKSHIKLNDWIFLIRKSPKLFPPLLEQTSIAGVNCQPSYPAWALSAEVHVTPPSSKICTFNIFLAFIYIIIFFCIFFNWHTPNIIKNYK